MCIGMTRLLAIVSLLAMSQSVALAQGWPEKPVRFITPTAAGGSLDTIARFVGDKLTKTLGQQIVVDNRPGAGGMIGAEAVARAAPDGYMVLVASNGNIATTKALYKNVPYDPVKDFAPVILMAETPYVIVVHSSLPVKSVGEFIRFAKAHPGEINYSSSGNGSTPHLAVELFRTMTGVSIVHVPYKGSPAALNSLISGETAFKITGLPSSYPFIKNGRIRALAIAGEKRVDTAPEIPAATESGLPGYSANSWAGILLPAGTSVAIVSKLNGEINRMLKDADTKKFMLRRGFEPLGSTPEEFGAFLRSEIEKWEKVIRDSRARVG